jgi:hypothetical protein
VFTEPHPALDLRLLVDEPGAPGGPLLCTMTRAAPGARCVALPAAITAGKQGLRLLGTGDDGAAPGSGGACASRLAAGEPRRRRQRSS